MFGSLKNTPVLIFNILLMLVFLISEDISCALFIPKHAINSLSDHYDLLVIGMLAWPLAWQEHNNFNYFKFFNMEYRHALG